MREIRPSGSEGGGTVNPSLLPLSVAALLLIKPEFVGCVEEGDDVLGRDAVLDVVDVVEDVAAAGLERLQVGLHMPADLVG